MSGENERPRSVHDVREALAPYGLRVDELPDDTSTAVLAAQALGTDVDTIVKSLVFVCDGTLALVLVAGSRRVDARILGRELDSTSVRLAAPEMVLQWTGYRVGGVPPVGHRSPLRTLMDRTLLAYPTVYAAAGSPNAIFAVSPTTLQEITAAQLTDATR